MSDLHLDFDRGIMEAAQSGQSLSAGELHWERHVQARKRQESGHPWLGPDLMDLCGAVDVVILAGDVARGTASVDYADQISGYCGCPVVLVPGNHEFYGGEFQQIRSAMVAAAGETAGRVALLDYDLGGVMRLTNGSKTLAIVGATLWTDYQLNGSTEAERIKAMGDAARILNDHKVISYDGKPFAPDDALVLHRAARAWLKTSVVQAKEQSDAVVVVTHHAAIAEANAPEFQGGILSPAFASDLRPEISQWQPDLWISGHTHHDHDVQIGPTRCLSHQRGYLGREAKASGFAPLVVVV